MLGYLRGVSALPSASTPTPNVPFVTPGFDSVEHVPSRMNDQTLVSENVEAVIPLSLTDLLRQLVHERTGYPLEMLDTQLDLEADLGIDSIKRVEILGSLRDARPDLNLSADGRVMDDLARARTLGQIVEHLERSSDFDRAALEVPSRNARH